MSMPVSGVGGYGAVNPYEAYGDYFSGNISGEEAAEMADAVDFDNDLDRAQNLADVRPVEQGADLPVRIEPAEESSESTSDHLRRELSHVMDDLLDIQGSLWGFSMRREIPVAEPLQM